MTRRLYPASAAVLVTCAPLSVVLAVRIGMVFLVPYAAAAAVVVAIGAVFPSRRRPEYWFFAGDVAILLAIAAAVALTGGVQSPVLWLMVVALVAAAGRHTDRGLLAYAGLIAVATAVACLLAVNLHVGFGDLRFTGFLTTATAVAILVITLRRAEREYREQSLVDPLTGTLNRLALMRRLEELRAQARLGAGRLCVIAADIDHFKFVNDTRGHEGGDAVLRDTASILRESLRAFPLLYRTGGEEFVALLPGLSRSEGESIAERLRAAVAESRPAGLLVTMSFGVACSGELGADPETVISLADQCLYEAKQRGRNRVIASVGAPEGLGARAAATAPALERRSALASWT